MGNQFKFKWEYTATKNSLFTSVLQYLNNKDLHPSSSKAELISKALSAFYVPIVLIGKGNSYENKQAVINCLETLYSHFLYICSMWQIDPTHFGNGSTRLSQNSANPQTCLQPSNLISSTPEIDNDQKEDEEYEDESELDEVERTEYMQRSTRMLSGINIHSYSSN